MTDVAAQIDQPTTTESVRARARLVPVSRRGPILQMARGGDPASGIFGLDLTAGCGLGCTFCHIRSSARFPGERKILFDPATTERMIDALEGLSTPPKMVVLSPNSDPLPPDRDVRAEAFRVVSALLERGIAVRLMTRGRIGRPMTELLAAHADLARVSVGITTMNRALSRALEPNAATPEIRLRGLGRLVDAGVAVEARIEPLIVGLTDTRANLVPLFRNLAGVGVHEGVAHYLFLQPAMIAGLAKSLAPFGWSEKLVDDFEGGPSFAVGSVGTTKHLPLDARQAGLAGVFAWGAEFGLAIGTGHAQNPDLPRVVTPTRIETPTRRDRPAAAPRKAATRRRRPAAKPVAVAVESELVAV